MGGRGSNYRGGGGGVVGASNATKGAMNAILNANANTQTVQQTPTPVPTNLSIGGDGKYVALTPQTQQQLFKQTVGAYDIDTQTAIDQYISKNAYSKAIGSGYSVSQDMNYRLDKGIKLDATESFMDSELSAGMKDLGANVVLYRGAHQDLLHDFGIRNYDKLSESQLQSKLVGQTYQTKSYTSTAWDVNKSPFLGNNALAGGREVVFKINAGSSTKVLYGARSQSEIIINKGTNYKITGVKYTGQTASPRGSSRSYKQIQIDVEVI